MKPQEKIKSMFGQSRKSQYEAKLVLAIAIAALATNVCIGSGTDEDDFEVWTRFGFNWKLDQRWQLTLDEMLRFNDDASNYYYSHTEVGLIYKEFLQDIDLGLSHRSVFGHTVRFVSKCVQNRN